MIKRTALFISCQASVAAAKALSKDINAKGGEATVKHNYVTVFKNPTTGTVLFPSSLREIRQA